jgi:CRP-like cAMP-binding protein
MHNQKTNIVEQITGGFINIDSVEEFEKILEDFPEDFALHKAYADLLVKKEFSDEAALSYGRAAVLYFKSGKLLPAVVSKLLQWRLKSLSYQEAQLFLSAVRDGSFPSTPLKIFLENLSNPEMFAVMKCIENIQLPAGQLIQKVDEIEEGLYFIVSGSIKETSYQAEKTKEETVYKRTVVNLSVDDTFGELYPIKEKKVCKSYIETIDPVELVKISKQVLLPICEKYPNAESALQAVSVFRSEFRKDNLLKKKRANKRHQLVRKMSLEIFPHSSANFPIILGAYSKNISIGGTCVVLDSIDVSVLKSVTSFSKTIKDSKVKISFPNEGIELKVSGKIVWTQETIDKGKKTLAVGIQFQDLSPKFRGMLFVFADNSKEQ